MGDADRRLLKKRGRTSTKVTGHAIAGRKVVEQRKHAFENEKEGGKMTTRITQ